MSEFSRLRRPKAGDTEEDILDQMKQFHLESNEGDTIVRKIQKDAKEENKFDSRSTSDRHLKRQHEDKKNLSCGVLKSTVVEKDVFFKDDSYSSAFIERKSFPSVMKLDKSLLNENLFKKTSSAKKSSIFAQQMKMKGFDHMSTSPYPEVASTRSSTRFERDFGTESLLLKNSKILTADESKGIHDGNVNILNSKTEDQILKDKESLLKTLDKSIVDFLMKKKKAIDHFQPEPEAFESSISVVSQKSNEKEVSFMEVEEIKDPSDAHSESNNAGESLDIDELKKFVNMEKVEAEKLEWMKDVGDEKETRVPIQFNARFDFSGNLLPFVNEDISIRSGLHHHGEEPNRPGYSLDELMTLCRSKFPQQRAIAFTTIANVIKSFKQGKFDGCFLNNKKLLEELIMADLVFLLRIGLDDNTSVSILDSVTLCLAELIDNEIEEVALDSQFFASVSNGFLQPSLQVKISNDENFQKEAPELKDVQIIRADLILGLLRMDTVERISYILNEIRPESQTTIVNIFRILTRMARHSLSTALKIVQSKPLMDCIFASFLPLTSALSALVKKLYGTPVHNALKLVRVLMSWSKSLTIELLTKYEVGHRILCYMSTEPSDLRAVPTQEVLRLIIEACRGWIVCLRYGLETQRFSEFFPIIMSHLKYLNANVSMNQADLGAKFSYHHATAILELISAAICCASSRLETFSNVDVHLVRDQLLDWSNFTSHLGIIDVIELSLKKWIFQIHNCQSNVQPFCYNLLDSGLTLYATYIERYSVSENYDPIALLTKLEDLTPFVCQHLLKNSFFSGMMSEILQHSVVSKEEFIEGRRRDPDNLPSLGSISLQGDILPTLRESSPFKTVNSILLFIKAALRAHSNLSLPEVCDFLRQEDLAIYIRKVVSVSYKQSSSNWFIKPEITFLQLLINLNHQLEIIDLTLMWQLGCVLAANYQVGEEYFVEEILKDVIFNSKYINKTLTVTWLDSSTDKMPNLSPEYVIPQMLKLYVRLLLPNEKEIVKSRFICQKLCFSTHTLTINSNGEACLPNDWPYMPLLSVLNNHTKPGSDQTKSEDLEIWFVQLSLQWIYYMNSTQKVSQQLSHSSVAFRLTRLSTVFLATSNLFFDNVIHRFLELNLKDLLSENGCPIFSDPIPGLDSFHEFYSQLVEQFQAVSYGNELFALFILLPCTRFNDAKYRTILWNDQPEALRTIVLSPKNLPKGMEIEVFVESDKSATLDLLRAYLKSLLSNTVVAKRNPLLYEIAIKNVCLGCKKIETFKAETLSQVQKLKREDLWEKFQ